MNTKKYVATFTEGLLATKPNDPNVHETFVAAKGREASEDELTAEQKALAEVDALEKGKTIFHRDEDGCPIIWNYQVKGFLKEAFKALRRDPNSATANIKAYKSIIDGNVFVEPRKIRLELPEGAELGTCQRPLRAQTLQGERVALASSEEAPAGTKISFSVMTLCPGLDKALDECWTYARLRFMGAWRNSGKGAAIVECVDAGTPEPAPKKEEGEAPAKKRGRPKKVVEDED